MALVLALVALAKRGTRALAITMADLVAPVAVYPYLRRPLRDRADGGWRPWGRSGPERMSLQRADRAR